MTAEKILILDFGSQYTQLIARRIREMHVFCEILPCDTPFEKIRGLSPKALVLSGGPKSVYDTDAPRLDGKVLEMGVPVLGICYGMQWIAHQLGGRVESAKHREYGPAEVSLRKRQGIFAEIEEKRIKVWMSHGDHVTELPPGFEPLAVGEGEAIAAIGSEGRRIYALQFHPEVSHTPLGSEILRGFLFRVCDLKADWSISSFVEETIREIRSRVGRGRVVCAVSGGVDSSVMAVLLHRAVGDQLQAFFIDNGLLRKNEGERVERLFQERLGIPLTRVLAAERFLNALAGVTDPEEKRRRIGQEFIAVFEGENASGSRYLAQGTLYPDVIESLSSRGPSATIKTHHNVGGLPSKMSLELIEPFRELFKDEVREIGRLLGVPEEIVSRQPFPGPGLAVRILGEVTPERLAILREADAIVVEEFKGAQLYTKIWQSFAVLLPVKTVGVMGDARTYENVVAIRAVTSRDGMTADWARLPETLLEKLSSRIINEVRGVNRVVYDISSKPPATIEWE